MNTMDYYGAVWDTDYNFMTHLSPGLKSFINSNDMNELHDFFAMMFCYSL